MIKGYLEQGLLVRDCAKIRALYLRNRQFLWDCASIVSWRVWTVNQTKLFLVAFGPHLLVHLLEASSNSAHQPTLSQGPNSAFHGANRDQDINAKRLSSTTSNHCHSFLSVQVGVVVWYIAVIIHWNAWSSSSPHLLLN